MSLRKGKNAKITVNGSTVAYVNSFEVSLDNQTEDVTSFGDTGNKYAKTMEDGSITIGGFLDLDDTAQNTLRTAGLSEDGTISGTLVYVSSTEKWTIPDTAIVENYKESGDPKSNITFSCSIRPNGALVRS